MLLEFETDVNMYKIEGLKKKTKEVLNLSERLDYTQSITTAFLFFIFFYIFVF